MGITGRYQVLRGLRVLQLRKVLVPCVQERTRIRFVEFRRVRQMHHQQVRLADCFEQRHPAAVALCDSGAQPHPQHRRVQLYGGEHAGEIQAEVRPPAAEQLCGQVAAHHARRTRSK